MEFRREHLALRSSRVKTRRELSGGRNCMGGVLGLLAKGWHPPKESNAHLNSGLSECSNEDASNEDASNSLDKSTKPSLS
jgi:hypothetical protein